MAGPVHPSVGGSDHGKSDLVGASELVEMSGHDDLPARKRHPEAEIQGEPLRLVEISSLMAHSNLDWMAKPLVRDAGILRYWADFASLCSYFRP
jgi:hypothetical protein